MERMAGRAVRVVVCLVAALAAAPVTPGSLAAQRPVAGPPYWFRGNTHTHTRNSDGDAAPDVVARWYREHDYQFVVITDHEYLTAIDGLNGLLGAPGRFLVMQGQEVTQWSADTTQRAAHVNAINNTRVVWPMGETRCIGSGCGRVVPGGVPLAETFRHNIAGIRAAGGLAQVNHPNGLWSVRPADLYDIPDSTLLEIWNGASGTHNLGGTDEAGRVALSTEALWDTLLTRGRMVWGVGSDDAHDFHKTDGHDLALPGQAWVVVQADTLTPEAITAALRRGAFYASTGVTLADLVADDTTVTVAIRRAGNARYRTQFIGRAGGLLAEVAGLVARYRLRGTEGYVRAVITDSNGATAWTQPVFVPHFLHR